MPFARTTAECLAQEDSRRSLEERYRNHEACMQLVKEIVRELQEARLLLPEDASRFVDEAADRNVFEP